VDAVPTQTELLHHSRGVVLDQDVSGGDQPLEDSIPSGRVRSSVIARFPTFTEWNRASPFPPHVSGRGRALGKTHGVGSSHRFNLDQSAPSY